jgi:uncharacterized protein (TIGR02646 family)
MIRIRRGAEPAGLASVRAQRLPIAESHALAGTLERRHFDGYDMAKEALWKAQHSKCCYCEKYPLERSRESVEHFRPALRARRGAGFSESGYWWLGWTWKNLLFCCSVCNSSAKVDQFPLEPGSPLLSAHEQPPGAERPLLIDPSVDDPMRHIQFRPVVSGGVERWLPFPRGGSLRGERTIAVLQLDRGDLVEHYGRHVEGRIDPAVGRVRAAMAAGDRDRAQVVWAEQLLPWTTSPYVEFSALSYDALDHRIPAGSRRAWGLPLRRPR